MLPKADAWIAIGTTFSQTTTGAWNLEKASQVIHIDIDPNQIGKIFQPSLGINADAKVVLRQLIDRVERDGLGRSTDRSEEHTSELQSLMRISYAVFCLKKKNIKYTNITSYFIPLFHQYSILLLYLSFI